MVVWPNLLKACDYTKEQITRKRKESSLIPALRSKTLPLFRLNASVLIRASLIPTLRSENLSAVLTECFSLHQGRLKHSVETAEMFSNLKVDIRDLFFPFMQEPTEKEPLQERDMP